MQFRTTINMLLVSLVFAGSTAWSGGLYISEFGQPVQGASGAGAGAIAQDASTAFTNPAGIMLLDESEWMVTGVGVYSSIEFDPQVGTTVTGNDGGDAGGFSPGAALFYSNPFSESFGFGFSFNAISAAVLDYDDGFVGRYWAEEVELIIAVAMPSFAYRVNDHWSVSLGLPIAYGQLDMDVAIPQLTPVAMGNDGQARIKDGDDFDVTLAAGVLWEITDRFRLGLTYSGEIEMEFDNDLEITLPAGGGTTLPQVSADVEMPFAQTLRLSGSSDIGDKLTVLATVAWEDWSTMDNVFISTSAGGGALPRDWDDTWHFALGMRWRTGGPWTFHTGVSYDTDPTNAQDRTADMPIDEQIRISGGATYQFSGGSSLGGVLTYADYGDADINNGGDWGQVVGDYSSNEILFMGINYGW
jgi:long-chain fatty acid transport protein